MKPNFALNLSHEGIGLLHRNTGSKDGWTLVGEVALDDPEMADKLEMLRKTAADLEKGGVETKLIIPNSQILYTELDAPGGDDIAREVQIRAALEGMTPYEVGDLVFDWRRAKGKKVKVAVVARETLQEAEQFAKDHRMNPVSFVARPEKGFKGEAFFGMATGASALLGPGNSVEPDKEPVPDLSRLGDKAEKADKAEQPEAAPPPETDAQAAADEPLQPAPKADAPKPSAEEAARSGAETPAPEAAAKAPAEPAIQPAATPEPEDGDEEDEDARVEALLAEVPEPDLPAAAKSTAPDKADLDSTADRPKKTPPAVLAPFPPTLDDDEGAAPGKRPLPPPPPRRKVPPIPKPPAAKTPATEPPVTAKPATKEPRTPAQSGQKAAGKTATKAPAAAPEADSAPTFASRRQHTAPADAPVGSGLKAERPQHSASNGRLHGALGAASAPVARRDGAASPAPNGPTAAPAKPEPEAAATANDAPAATKAGLIGKVASKAAKGLIKRGKTTEPAAPKAADANGKAGPASAARTLDTQPTAASTAIAPGPSALPGTTAAGPPATASEAERLTMFGARPSQRHQVGGKPKYLGLVLTLVLLLVMAAIALASVFLFTNDNAATPGQDAPSEFAAASVPEALLPGTATNGATPVQPTAEPPPVAGNGDTLPTQPTAPESPGATGQIDTSPIAAPAPEVPSAPAPPPAADAPAQSPDPMTEEAAQTRYAAVGIWERAPDSPPEPQGSRIDDLYIASIDPKVAGNDAVALPQAPTAASDQRPATPMPPPPPGTDFALGDDGLVTPSPEGTLTPSGILVFSGKPPVVPPPRPGTVRPAPPNTDALRAFRPKPRPTSLIEDNERANNAGNSLLELAAFRPKPRPATVQVAPDAVDQAVASAAAADQAAAAATDQAVATSPLPGHRPGNFSTIVASARTASGSDGSSVVAASAAATTTPAIPTRANVARQATMTNAIRLNKLTLIGIYGSSSSRRALVRLSNGRYRKVSVGDRLNGGKVVSITESRLIYTKSGRNHTLDLIPLG